MCSSLWPGVIFAGWNVCHDPAGIEHKNNNVSITNPPWLKL
jgi:hypothetical protein